MGIFSGYLLCSDIDGTLVDESGKISRENLNAINYFTSNGGMFVIASGRYYDYCETKLGYKSLGPIIALNGGHIYDMKTKKSLWENSFGEREKEIALEIFETVLVEEKKANINYLNKYETVTDIEALKNALYGKDVPFKVVFIAKEEIGEKICEYTREKFKDEVKVVRSLSTLTEILPLGSSKDKCLEKIVNLNPQIKTVVAVGDYENDIEMVKRADIGYAVENAIPQLKAVAKRFAPKHTENAIAYIIKELENEVR